MRNLWKLCSIALVCMIILQFPSVVQADAIPVQVNTRVELLAIIFRLAGAGEYNMPASQSPYAEEVAQQFGPFKDHPAVKLAAKLRAEHGIGFDAVMSYAVHLREDRLEPKIPFEAVPAPLDSRWEPEDASRFVIELRKFVADSKADQFFARHKTYYAKASDRLSAELTRRPYRSWLDSFFGSKPRTRFVAVVGLLNGGGNYGMAVRYPGGNEEILPVIGASEFDSEGLPVFRQETASLIAHEFCHSYTNPLVDKFAAKLLSPAEKIFPYRRALMEQQAYSTPKTMLYESMVRACVVRFALDNDTPENAAKQLMAEQARGFLWMPGLVELLGKYTAERRTYPNLEAFMPEVVALFDRTADSMEARMAKLPHIVSLSPANGDTKVDSTITELRIEFDRPMQTDHYAIVGDPAQTPASSGKPHFSSDGKVFLLPIKMEPGKTYTFGINSLYQQGFRSVEGQLLDPVKVTFTTLPHPLDMKP